MSESIFETFTDERGNISVRISQEVQVLTREEAERIEAEYKRMQADNAKLREELADAPKCETCEAMLDCDECLRADGSHKERRRLSADNAKLRELVRKVLQFERAGCEGCPYASTCDADCLYDPDCPMREDIERDMRELGVDE